METSQPSLWTKYKFTLISLFIILLAAIPILIFSKKYTASTRQQSLLLSPTPTAGPLTQQNADSEMTQADQSMQQTLDQADLDLNAAAQVDGTQDSTAGL